MSWLDWLLRRPKQDDEQSSDSRPRIDPDKIRAERRRSELLRRIDAVEMQLRAETRLRDGQ